MRTVIIQPRAKAPKAHNEHYTVEDMDFVTAFLSTLGTGVTLFPMDESLVDKLRFYQRRSPIQVIDMAYEQNGVDVPSSVPALCRQFNIPYVGNSAVPHTLLTHTGACKAILSQGGVAISEAWPITQRDTGRAVGLMSAHPSTTFALHEWTDEGMHTVNLSKHDVLHTRLKAGRRYLLCPDYAGPVIRQPILPGLTLLGLTESGKAVDVETQQQLDAIVSSAIELIGVDGPAQFDFIQTHQGLVLTRASCHAILKENSALFQSARRAGYTQHDVAQALMASIKND